MRTKKTNVIKRKPGRPPGAKNKNNGAIERVKHEHHKCPNTDPVNIECFVQIVTALEILGRTIEESNFPLRAMVGQKESERFAKAHRRIMMELIVNAPEHAVDAASDHILKTLGERE